jgi:hypothetical protein
MLIIGGLLAALLQVTLGLLFAAVLCDWRGQVTRGFLFLAAGTALLVALLAFGLGGLSQVGGLERLTEVVLLAGLAVYSLLCGTGLRGVRLAAGGLGLAAGLITLALAAQVRPSPLLGPDLTTLTYLLSALALGTALGGLLLGHWYLTTPWLTSRPLKLLCDLLLVSLLPLTALAGWYLLRGGDGGGAGGLSGAALWVAAGMVTLFPFGVTVAARVCCIDGPGRGRSLQAATGLLYLVAAAVLAGGLAGNAVLLGA